jgi:hypothetical protein
MAVVPKHKGGGSRYDPSKELTADQLHRFGKAAGQAQKRKEEQVQLGTIAATARVAKETAMKPISVPKKGKRDTVRYAVWMVVLLASLLWVMYMTH